MLLVAEIKAQVQDHSTLGEMVNIIQVNGKANAWSLDFEVNTYHILEAQIEYTWCIFVPDGAAKIKGPFKLHFVLNKLL